MVLEREFAPLEHDLCRPRQAGVPQYHQLFDKRKAIFFTMSCVGVWNSHKEMRLATLKHLAEREGMRPTPRSQRKTDVCYKFTPHHGLVSHLLGNDGEHFDVDAVEFVQARPCPSLYQARKKSCGHGVIDLI